MSTIKQLIANLPGIRHYLHARHRKRCRLAIVDMVQHDARRVLEYGGFRHQEHPEALLAAIGMEYHRLEKGLTMPDFRPGFGQGVVTGLISLIRRYAATHPLPAFEVSHALAILAEYRNLHRQYPDTLNKATAEALDGLLGDMPAEASCQPAMTPEAFWADAGSDFPRFSASRHCVRELAGPAPVESIRAAVGLACNAPSACNRQYVRVHFYNTPEKIREILALQNGNRGFGHLASQLLIITTDFSGMRWQEERHDMYTNAGIFLMNLCYALHYHKVAHCLLNWSEGAAKDAALHSLAGIPEQEAIVTLITCGKPADHFKLTSSPRKSAQDILTMHP